MFDIDTDKRTSKLLATELKFDQVYAAGSAFPATGWLTLHERDVWPAKHREAAQGNLVVTISPQSPDAIGVRIARVATSG